MSYGMRTRSAGGSILFDSNNYSLRMVYRRDLGSIPQGLSVTVPGFDGSKGVMFVVCNTPDSRSWIPRHTISGSTITFGWSGDVTANYTLYAVMFS